MAVLVPRVMSVHNSDWVPGTEGTVDTEGMKQLLGMTHDIPAVFALGNWTELETYNLKIWEIQNCVNKTPKSKN